MSLTIPLKLSSLSARFSDEHEEAFFKAWHSVLDNAETLAESAVTRSGINLKSGSLAQKVDYNIESATEAEFVFESHYAAYLDEGYDSYDQKPGLLNGPKSRVSKEGWRYNRIPIEGEIRTVSEKPWTQQKRNNKGQFTNARKWVHPGISGYHFSKLLQDEVVKKVEDYLSELDFEDEDNLRLEHHLELADDEEDFFDMVENATNLVEGVPLSIGFLDSWDVFWDIVDQSEDLDG